MQPVQSNDGNEIATMNTRIDSTRSLANEGKQKRGKTFPASILTADKVYLFYLPPAIDADELIRVLHLHGTGVNAELISL